MGQYKEGHAFRVTKLNGILAWKSWDGVTVVQRDEQLAPGECLILVEECFYDEGHAAGVWKALTRLGMRYFLLTTLKTGTERL